jgi:DNA-binding transcriptional MerR regulator
MEAARLFHVTTKTLRGWAKAGALVPVYGKNKLRIGYTEASVRALAEA